MKIFAVILLMLVSATLLNAQTMVVETADSVESFEVGKVKAMSAFEKEFNTFWVKCKNIPLTTAKLVLNDSQVIRMKASFIQDTISGGSLGTSQINFIFLDQTDPKWGTGTWDKITIILDPQSPNLIKQLFLATSGSTGGCYDPSYYNNPYRCTLYGQFEILLNDLTFELDSSGNFFGRINGAKINSHLQKFYHKEWEVPAGSTIEVNKIEDGLNENSEITFSFE